MKRTVLLVFVWVAIITLIIVVLGLAGSHQRNSPCVKVEVEIKPVKNCIINQDDLRIYLSGLTDSANPAKMGSLDIEALEQSIRGDPGVIDAQVYANIGGEVKVEVIPREPIIRVQNVAGQQFYITRDGHLILIRPGKTVHVPVATGQIIEMYWEGTDLRCDTAAKNSDSIINASPLRMIYQVALYMADDEFFQAQIEQIYVNKYGELEMIPKVGDHVILFGGADRIKDKFDNLKVFYIKGMINDGWERYRVINVKFSGQIVCS